MKKSLSILLSLSWLAALNVATAGQPQGKLVELHSCEVYAGGCIYSSEGTQGGRYMLQAWDISKGSWNGVDLAGLQTVVLQTSSENLAETDSRPEHSIVYLPKSADAAHREALLGWLKSSDARLASSDIQTRIVPVSVVTSGDQATVSAGKFASFRTLALADCKCMMCGESLWYEPSTPTSQFTVAANAGSAVNEPLLKLQWTDHGKRSVFVADFGGSGNAKNLYVQSSDWCGAERKIVLTANDHTAQGADAAGLWSCSAGRGRFVAHGAAQAPAPLGRHDGHWQTDPSMDGVGSRTNRGGLPRGR